MDGAHPFRPVRIYQIRARVSIAGIHEETLPMRAKLRIRECCAVFEGLFRGNKFPRAHNTSRIADSLCAKANPLHIRTATAAGVILLRESYYSTAANADRRNPEPGSRAISPGTRKIAVQCHHRRERGGASFLQQQVNKPLIGFVRSKEHDPMTTPKTNRQNRARSAEPGCLAVCQEFR
jgi:hypothetical protein